MAKRQTRVTSPTSVVRKDDESPRGQASDEPQQVPSSPHVWRTTFAVVKRVSGIGKVRYRGLDKTPRARSLCWDWPTYTLLDGTWHEFVPRWAQHALSRLKRAPVDTIGRPWPANSAAATIHIRIAEIGGLFSVALVFVADLVPAHQQLLH